MWEKYLTETKEKNYNYEHLENIKSNKSNLVYKYIMRCLDILEKEKTTKEVYYYVSETIKWSDVSKCGSVADRKKWKKHGFILDVHNIGSSQIYELENKYYDEVIKVLISTHGLIGQYIRGEINLNSNKELYELIEKKLISKSLLKEVLTVLNKCIISAVNEEIYNSIEKEVAKTIEKIINNKMDETINIKDKLKRLNSKKTITSVLLEKEEVNKKLTALLKQVELWYYESALSGFSIDEQIKLLLIIANETTKEITHITFSPIMKQMYLDYNNQKTINIYKKRILECMLKEIEIEELIEGKTKNNVHVKCDIKKLGNTLTVNFKFSKQATKLIEFCEIAYTSNSLYNKAVYMLYELFGFRRDEYDRFYNEIDYLNTMNSSMNSKKVLLDFITGKSILDVGPGGGALMNMIETELPESKVYGIDISKNVIEELNKKKQNENHKWTLVEGDALNLGEYFKKGQVDTIIYSSIIHELYSYIQYKGRKFNIETVKVALQSADSILKKGGRIIIRDGIKTEPENEYRIIKFANKEDNRILDNYCKDFKGRKITYERINDDTVKMLVNDAMEFLYTYTWGENSYSLEVKEQFGYLTPSEYTKLIEDNLSKYKIIFAKAFLQEGYEENLLNKISIYDEEMNVVKLPNSTYILVIEKE